MSRLVVVSNRVALPGESFSGGLAVGLQAALEARGHKLREGTRRWGNMQVVIWNYKTGDVEAASDPRGAGVGLVY